MSNGEFGKYGNISADELAAGLAGLEKQRDELEEGIRQLKEKLYSLGSKNCTTPRQNLGVPFTFLSLLCCPACNSGMNLDKGYIRNNMVTDADLKCACGKNGVIKDGIVMTGSPQDNRPAGPAAVNAECLNAHASPEYISFLYKGLDWLTGRMTPVLHANCVLLELGAGSGRFLRHAAPRLPVDSTYIAVDWDFEKLRYVKSLAEIENGWYTARNIVFVCCSFRDIPLKEESLDIIIDYYGTTNYNFYKPGYPVEWLSRKLKKGGRWLGAYFVFRPGSKSLLQIPEDCRHYFYQSYLSSAFEKSPLMFRESEDLGFAERAGEHESFLIEGDRVYQWVYHGERVK